MKSALCRTAPLYSCKYPRKYLVDFELPHSPHRCSLSVETFFKTTSKLQSLLQTAVHCTKLIYFKLLIPSAQFIKCKQPKSSQVKLLRMCSVRIERGRVVSSFPSVFTKSNLKLILDYIINCIYLPLFALFFINISGKA